MQTPDEKRAYLAGYYKRNSDVIKKRSHDRYHANSDEIIQKQKMSRQEDPAKHNKNNRAWRAANLEKARESSRNWARRNLESHRLNEHKRRASSSGHHPYTVMQILTVHGTSCHICKEPIDLNAPKAQKYKGWEMGLHLDHVIPISRGGIDAIENVKPAHGICNLRKGAA